MATAALKSAPALATGNCFILKPSEKTPFGALALGTLIKEAGFPPGVFQVISGDGSTGALLASHMKVRKISFTGSTITGRRIQEMAAKSNLKRITLELGGKSPAVVFDDANLENAIFWCVNAICGNTGQICFAASRVYVQEGIFDKFAEGYKKAMEERAKTIGDPDADGTMMGPIVDKLQFDRVSGFLERGRSQGTLLTGGSRVGDQVSSKDEMRRAVRTLTFGRDSLLSRPSSQMSPKMRRSARRRSSAPSRSSISSRQRRKSSLRPTIRTTD